MKKQIISVVVLIVIILLITFISQIISTNKEEVLPENNVQEEEQFMETLVVKHQYKDGTHIFVGDIETPTPCYDIEAGFKEPNFLYVNTKAQDTECVQVIDTKTFKIEVEGSQDMEFKAFVNDEERRLNVFDLAPDVDIEEFEIFIKG
jgi:hypothetical protein